MQNNKKTILLVEDTPLVFSIYLTWLQRYGFKVEGARDGEMALKKLPQLRPDVVVLDWRLPKLSGQEILNFIRTHPELKQTPVLILSDAFIEEASLRAASGGVNKQLPKTQCTPRILAQSIREVLGLVPPPNWQSEVFPLSADSDGAVVGKTNACATEPGCRELFARIREASLAFAKETASPARAELLKKLQQHVQQLRTCAAREGFTKIVRVAAPLEAMLLEFNPQKSPSPSIPQTIAQAVDGLDRLFQKGDLNSVPVNLAARVLVVDDDPICNLAATTAMRRAKLETAGVRDPQAALQMARTERYHAVLLDINMPGMSGFEFCKQLRQLPEYKRTPVIFVTSDSEFQNRAQAVLSGGNDLIAKPIWPPELALKMIMRLTESLDQPADKTPAGIVAPPATAPALSLATDPTAKPENKIPVTAKTELPEAARNGDATQTPAGPDILNLAPYHQPPRAASPPAPARRGFEPLPIGPIRPPGAGRNLEKPAGNHRGDKLFDKTTRELARIEASSTSQIALAGNGRKQAKSVKKTNADGPLEKITLKITSLLFGENTVSGAPLHLTRIALENYRVPEIINQNSDERVSADGSAAVHDHAQLFQEIIREVALTLFDDTNLTEIHLRLTRFALEHYRVPEIICPAPSSDDPVDEADPMETGSSSTPNEKRRDNAIAAIH